MYRPQHKAAGALPFARLSNGLHVLLPFEGNGGTRRCKYYGSGEGCRRQDFDCDYIHIEEEALRPEEYDMSRLNLLGGRREEGETILQTAVREFSEETAGLIKPIVTLAMLQHATTTGPYAMSGGYQIYFCRLEECFNDIDVHYLEIGRRPRTAEAEYLVWVPVQELLSLPIKRDDRIGPHISVREILYPLSHLLMTLLARHRAAIEDFVRCFTDDSARH